MHARKHVRSHTQTHTHTSTGLYMHTCARTNTCASNGHLSTRKQAKVGLYLEKAGTKKILL